MNSESRPDKRVVTEVHVERIDGVDVLILNSCEYQIWISPQDTLNFQYFLAFYNFRSCLYVGHYTPSDYEIVKSIDIALLNPCETPEDQCPDLVVIGQILYPEFGLTDRKVLSKLVKVREHEL